MSDNDRNAAAPDAAEIAAIRAKLDEFEVDCRTALLVEEDTNLFNYVHPMTIRRLLAAVEALEAENARLKAQWNDRDLVWQHAWRMRDQATGDCATSIVDDDSVPYNRLSEGE